MKRHLLSAILSVQVCVRVFPLYLFESSSKCSVAPFSFISSSRFLFQRANRQAIPTSCGSFYLCDF